MKVAKAFQAAREGADAAYPDGYEPTGTKSPRRGAVPADYEWGSAMTLPPRPTGGVQG